MSARTDAGRPGGDRTEFSVGDPVIVTDSIRRTPQPERREVVKVGRALLHVADTHGNIVTFRLDTGHTNDNYGHQAVYTMFAWQRREEAAAARARLSNLNIRIDQPGGHGSPRLSNEALHAIADIIEADRSLGETKS